MRKKVIAGNWKMNNDLSESQSLISKLINALSNEKISCDVIVCPPFTQFEPSTFTFKKFGRKLGAQNMVLKKMAHLRGEISASMLKSTGCEYVILGHSERDYFRRDDQVINKKL